MARRNSVFPTGYIPKISVSGPSEAAQKKEKTRKQMDEGFLKPPRWKYKQSKDVKKLNKVKEKKEKKRKHFSLLKGKKTFF